MSAHDDLDDLILARLYGLLDADQDAELDRRLAALPDAADATARVERLQSLLAKAARGEFPGVSFEPPTTRPAGKPAAAAAAGFGKWFVAAAALLAIGGLGWPAASYLAGHYKGRQMLAAARAEQEALAAERQQAVARFQKERAAAGADYQAATARVQAYREKANAELEKLERDVRAKQIYLVVTGPESLQPGAPNTFQVETRAVETDAVTPATLGVRVVDAKSGRALFEQQNLRSAGVEAVRLPLDLPATPGTELALELTATKQGGPAAELRERTTLSRPVYAAHLATDKPMYKPGETVRYRALVLDRFSMKPPAEDMTLSFALETPRGDAVELGRGRTELQTADGKVVHGPDGKPLRGVGCGEYAIPESLAGGEYTLKVTEEGGKFPAQSRKFVVNAYVPDTLEKELEFHRKSYGPGDEVVANCKVTENNRPLAGRPVTAVLRVDGKDVPAQAGTTDAAGAVAVRAKLPAKVESGIATVTVTFDNGGAVEALVKPVPLVLTRLDVEFFPEGGDLVAGVPNRVYFQARTPTGKPAELKGVVLDDQGKEVAAAETLSDPAEPGINQGQGAFTFTPQPGRAYTLKVTHPATVTSTPELPKAKAGGVALTVADGVTADGGLLNVRVASPDGPRNLLVGAYARGRLLDHKKLALQPGQPGGVVLNPAPGFGGVTRVTVFEEAGKEYRPVAERLVYRRPAQKLSLACTPASSPSLPGDKVRLTVAATDEAGKPAPAVLMLAVVNQSVVTMADEKTARSLPTHFLLTSEVRNPEDLEHADVLLGTHPKAAAALDLLLGTQGWRRFAEQNPAEFRQKNPAAAERILVRSGGEMRKPLAHTIEAEQEKLLAAVQPEYDRLAAELKAAHAKLAEPAAQEKFQAERAALDARLGVAAAAAAKALEGVREYERRNERLRDWLLPVACAVLLGVGIIGLMRAAVRRLREAVPYYAGSAAALAMCGLVLMATLLTGEPTATSDRVVAQAAPRPMAAGPQMDFFAADGVEVQGGAAPMMEAAAAAPAAAPAMPGGPGFAGGRGGADDRRRNNQQLLKVQNGQAPPAVAVPPAPPRAAARPEPLQRMMREAEGGKGDKAGKDQDAQKGGENRNELRKAVEEQAKKLPARRGLLADGKELDRAADKKQDAVKEEKALMPRQQEAKAKLAAPAEPEPANKPMDAAPAAPPPLGKVRIIGNAVTRDAVIRRQSGRFRDREMARPALGQLKQEVIDQLRRLEDVTAVVDGPVAGEPPPAPPTVVREYHHAHAPAVPGQPRTDFTETVCWVPALVLDAKGAGAVEFDLADAVGRYRVLAAGHTLDGRLGSAVSFLEARKPFSVDPKLPVEVTATDRIDVPVAVTNDTNDRRTVTVRVQPANLVLEPGTPATGTADAPEQALTLAPNERARRVFRFAPGVASGEAALAVEGASRPFDGDTIVRTMKVVPDGFPQAGSVSDQLEGRAEATVKLPAWVKGSLTLKAEVYPSMLADLQQGLEGLLREPGGCFEQTSTSNYPNLLILDYLEATKQSKPEVVKRAKLMLERGYGLLTGYECQDPADGKKREGYEWFGGTAAPHEALTAYGLLQFRDMSRVYNVDQSMLDRTRKYLLSRLDRTKWTFQRNPRALDTFGGAPPEITDAYIVWALTEVKGETPDDLGKLPEVLLEKAGKSKDPYFLALVGTAMVNLGRADDGVGLLKRVAAAQAKDGSVPGAATSITRSGGQSLLVETTALAVLGWLKANRVDQFGPAVKSAVKWVGTQRGGGGAFGSTQSTILALKALLAYTRTAPKEIKPGKLRLLVGDELVGDADVGPTASDAITVSLPADKAEAKLKPGDNRVRVELTGGSVLPYTLAWNYHTLKPVSAEKCAVKLTTTLAKAEVVEGESVRLTAVVENATPSGQGMAVAIIGLPAGLKLPEDMKQLKEMARPRDNGTKPGLIGFWEVKGRELVLYWRDLAPGQRIEVPLDLIGNVPGRYRGPASRAYLYYTPEQKVWAEPLSANVTVKPAG